MRDIVIFGLVPKMSELDSTMPGQVTVFDTVSRDHVREPALATDSGTVHARS